MPPVLARRTASIPTLFSLSKLAHLVPAAIKSHHAKRNTEWAVTAAAMALEEGGEGGDSASAGLMFKLLLSVALVLLGGVFAGLTLALMGSDDLNLRVLAASSDDPKERKDAAKVLRLLNRGRHWVLVVLLLANVIVNESLPIFLHDVLGGGFYAVAVSTIMIVIFGEVIPQAICVRYGLAIGGACAPLVQFMMWIFAPVAWPLAKLLDYVLGHDSGHTYKKAELKSFLQFHREGEEPLRDDEITILNGVLSLNERHVKEIMTPIGDCLVLAADKILDHETVDHILISGFSRIPIHEPGQPDNFVGMLLVKRLITYNPEDGLPVNKFTLNSLPEATPDLNCFQALDYFQTGRAHLLLISETPGRRGGALGILSLEDLIEEIIGEEIIDETDRYEDNHSKRKAQRRATRDIMRGIIERQRVINAFSRRPSASGSRGQSPRPGPREGILVQLGDTITTEPGELGSSLKNEVKPDDKENLTIIATSPAGIASTIVEQAAPLPGDDILVGDHSSADESDKTATPPKSTADDDGKAADVTNGKANPKDDKADKADKADDKVEDKIEDKVEDKASVKTDEADSVPETPTTASNGPSASDNKKKANGSKRRKVLPPLYPASPETFLEPFPSPESFKSAALAFIAKYDGRARALGPERTNVGWQWKCVTSKWRRERGYMYRRGAIYTMLAPRTAPSTDPSAPPSEIEQEEEEEDDAAAAPPTRCERVEVEYHVVYSPTYRVPMVCIRAWDERGVPLPLPDLVTHVLRASVPTTTDADGDAERHDALMLPGAPFPLLQQTEHPVTGDLVWSVHPCEVRGAVAEIVRGELEAEAEAGAEVGARDGAEGRENAERREEYEEDEKDEEEKKDEGGNAGVHEGSDSHEDAERDIEVEIEREGESKEAELERIRVRWLEAWFMLSDSVVDLTL